MRILVVEDEKRLNRIISEALEDEGYSVDSCFNGLDALDYAAGADYDVIILDIMMPKMNGFEVLKILRKEGCKTPVLFLTAKSEIEDRIQGLDLGADDYLPKPFHMGELLARVKAMLCRRDTYVPDILSYEDITLNPNNYQLSCGDTLIRA